MKNESLNRLMQEMSKKKAPKKTVRDIIVDPMGQWAHPGENTRIPSNKITMKGVPYPVKGIDNNGFAQMMFPDEQYDFPGADYVDEYPQLKNGGNTHDIQCPNCGWSWDYEKSDPNPMLCHKCGEMANLQSGGQYGYSQYQNDGDIPKALNGEQVTLDDLLKIVNNKAASDNTGVKKQQKDTRTLAEKKADDAKDLYAKMLSQQPTLQQASSPINDERRRRLNEQYAQQSGKRYNQQTGSIEDRFTPQQDRMLNRAYENIVEPIIEGEMYASAAPLIGKGVKAAGKFLTESTPLKNAYKLNSEAAYRGIGEAGYNNLLSSGEVQSLKQNASEIDWGKEYFQKLKIKDKELQKLAVDKKITDKEYLSQNELYEEQLQKELGLGEMLGRGAYGSVHTLVNAPSKVIKLGNPMSKGQAHAKNWTPELIEQLKSVRQNANIAIPENVQYFEIPSLYQGYGSQTKEVMEMPNLNKVQAINLNLNKRDRYALFLKQARQLRDKGVALDVNNMENFKFNADKGVFDIYDVNPYHIKDPVNYMQNIKNKTRNPLFESMLHKNGGYIPQAQGVSKIKKDDNGYWNPENWGKPVEIGSNNITMQGVNQPLIGISDEGDVQYMQPGEDYKFKGKKVVEYPIAQKGGSIVNYLKSKGESYTKEYRKKLAEQYNVKDYNFSDSKNLELLQKLYDRDNKINNEKKLYPFISDINDERNNAVNINDNTYLNVPLKNKIVAINTNKMINTKEPKSKKKNNILINPYTEVDSKNADIFRKILPFPSNVNQALAKTVFKDARMSNESLSDEQKVMLWDIIQNAKNRKGKNTEKHGGTEYQDYGGFGHGSSEQYNKWFNKGDVNIIDGAMNSVMNPYFQLASTIGRGNYWQDPNNPEDIQYTDVYDWNPGERMFKGNGAYQNIRNSLRKTEDPNLNKNKNDNYRMNFKLSKKEIDKIKEQQNDQTNLGLGLFNSGGSTYNGGVWYQDGGQQAPEQDQQQEMVQQIAQALQQGENPEKIVQALVQNGIDVEQAKGIVSAVMQQLQGGGQQSNQMPMAQDGEEVDDIDEMFYRYVESDNPRSYGINIPDQETKSKPSNLSIVDYLNSAGEKSDYNTRKSLAQQYGIANYRGTAEQNLKLLDKLKSGVKSTNKTSEASYNPNDGNILRKGYTEPSFDNRDVSFKTGKENKPSQNKQKRKLSAAEQYIANDPYFFADEGDNKLIMALDAPFTELRNLGARVALDKDPGALLQLLATGALSNMLPKTKILPYNVPRRIAESQTISKAIPYIAKSAAEAYARFMASKTLPKAAPKAISGAYKMLGNIYMGGGNIPNYMQDPNPLYNFGGYFPQGPRFDYGGQYFPYPNMNNNTPNISEMKEGGIHINPSKRGTFTAVASKHGKSVQEFASQVLANKQNYSPAMVKKANFARNASKWKHESGGLVNGQVIDVTPDMLEQLKAGGYTFEILND